MLYQFTKKEYTIKEKLQTNITVTDLWENSRENYFRRHIQTFNRQ